MCLGSESLAPFGLMVEPKAVHGLTSSSWLTYRCLLLATQKPHLTQSRTPVLVQTINGAQHNRAKATARVLYLGSQVEGAVPI